MTGCETYGSRLIEKNNDLLPRLDGCAKALASLPEVTEWMRFCVCRVCCAIKSGVYRSHPCAGIKQLSGSFDS